MKLRLLIFLIIPAIAFSQTINIMTYNIRYDNPADGDNAWSMRKESLAGQIQKYNPAILGIQEGLYNQVLYLDSCLTNYTYVGVGREDGKTRGEYSAIFYDTTQFMVLESSTFWLSKTPGQVSVGWDAAMERICTYALLESRQSGKKIWVFNTHFDHIGTKARKNSAKLIIRKIKSLDNSDIPIILTGDFNSIPGSEPVKIICGQLVDSYAKSVDKNTGPAGTFNGFDKESAIDEKIDFIFVKNIQILSCQHINEMRDDGFFISDHLPVLVCVKMF